MTDARAIVEGLLDDIAFFRDDGTTTGTFNVLYPGGPEDLYDLFITAAYDSVLVVGEPRLRERRYIQNVPTYDAWVVPVTIRCIDKFSSGTRKSTAPLILEKVRRQVQAKVEAGAVGSGYTVKVLDGQGSVSFAGGVYIHEQVMNVEVQESQ
jgi:hypothetical protein